MPAPWEGLIAPLDEATGQYDGDLTVSFLFVTKNGVYGALRLEPPVSRQFQPGMAAPAEGGWQYSFIAEAHEEE